MPTNPPSNRSIALELLTLAAAKHKWLVGMDTDGTTYRIVPSPTLIGRWVISQRKIGELGWHLWAGYLGRTTPETAQTMLGLSIPITGWHLVKGG